MSNQPASKTDAFNPDFIADRFARVEEKFPGVYGDPRFADFMPYLKQIAFVMHEIQQANEKFHDQLQEIMKEADEKFGEDKAAHFASLFEIGFFATCSIDLFSPTMNLMWIDKNVDILEAITQTYRNNDPEDDFEFPEDVAKKRDAIGDLKQQYHDEFYEENKPMGGKGALFSPTTTSAFGTLTSYAWLFRANMSRTSNGSNIIRNAMIDALKSFGYRVKSPINDVLGHIGKFLHQMMKEVEDK